jgi:DNA-directed RNA polymerase subunit H (RpoH/RPB5)
MTTEWKPARVYNNLKKFIHYRNITTGYNFVSENELSKLLEHTGYIKITGRRDDLNGARDTTIFMLAQGSIYASKSDAFSKLLQQLGAPQAGSEICFIADVDEVSTHINRSIMKFKAINPGVIIDFYSYTKFIIVIPEHKAVPPMRIASKKEIEELCDNYYTTQDKLPKIKMSDPSCIWIGPRPGNVLIITRDSDICVTSLAYRLVIR